MQQRLHNSDTSERLTGVNDGHAAVTDIGSRRGDDGTQVIRTPTRYERRYKRTFDVVVGSTAAVASAPLAALIAVAVRIGLGKPVLYQQERIGKDGEIFTIYKFRSMRPDRRNRVAELPVGEDRRTGHKKSNDPRHTGLGRKLRSLSLDELPQLINVLRGEMSLVGPRPEIPESAVAGNYADHIRHDVKPGMTGPYQVSSLRLRGDLRDGLHLDADYVFNMSFRRDVRYVFATIKLLLSRPTGS